jgi:hypothetical protein
VGEIRARWPATSRTINRLPASTTWNTYRRGAESHRPTGARDQERHYYERKSRAEVGRLHSSAAVGSPRGMNSIAFQLASTNQCNYHLLTHLKPQHANVTHCSVSFLFCSRAPEIPEGHLSMTPARHVWHSNQPDIMHGQIHKCLIIVYYSPENARTERARNWTKSNPNDVKW